MSMRRKKMSQPPSSPMFYVLNVAWINVVRFKRSSGWGFIFRGYINRTPSLERNFRANVLRSSELKQAERDSPFTSISIISELFWFDSFLSAMTLVRTIHADFLDDVISSAVIDCSCETLQIYDSASTKIIIESIISKFYDKTEASQSGVPRVLAKLKGRGPYAL